MEREMDKKIEITKSESIAHPLSFFSDDEQFVFLFKKTQKLVSALYLITGFFKDEEPVKWKLRSLGSALLSESVSLKDGSISQKDKAIQGVRILVLEVTALLEVARQSGMITEMNYEIITKEFNLLLNSMSHSDHVFEQGVSTLKQEFFRVSREERKAPETSHVQVQVMEKDKQKEVFESRYLPPLSEIRKSVQEDRTNRNNSMDVGHNTADSKKDPKLLKEFGAVAVKRNSRQSIIINLLKRKKEIMIKDVSPLIHGCSEKTIQRELQAMVHSGILHKEGEKRWSRYSLVGAL
jgi:hypothetical protein